VTGSKCQESHQEDNLYIPNADETFEYFIDSVAFGVFRSFHVSAQKSPQAGNGQSHQAEAGKGDSPAIVG